MKIELIKRTDKFGDTIWQTQIDGEYVSGSLSLEFDQAKEKYNALKRTKGEEKKETIESVTI